MDSQEIVEGLWQVAVDSEANALKVICGAEAAALAKSSCGAFETIPPARAVRAAKEAER